MKFLFPNLRQGRSHQNHQIEPRSKIEPYTPEQLEQEKEKLHKRWGGIIPVLSYKKDITLLIILDFSIYSFLFGYGLYLFRDGDSWNKNPFLYNLVRMSFDVALILSFYVCKKLLFCFTRTWLFSSVIFLFSSVAIIIYPLIQNVCIILF